MTPEQVVAMMAKRLWEGVRSIRDNPIVVATKHVKVATFFPEDLTHESIHQELAEYWPATFRVGVRVHARPHIRWRLVAESHVGLDADTPREILTMALSRLATETEDATGWDPDECDADGDDEFDYICPPFHFRYTTSQLKSMFPQHFTFWGRPRWRDGWPYPSWRLGG